MPDLGFGSPAFTMDDTRPTGAFIYFVKGLDANKGRPCFNMFKRHPGGISGGLAKVFKALG